MSKKIILFVVLMAIAILGATLWFGMQLGVRSTEQGAARDPVAAAGRTNSPSLPPVPAASLPRVQSQAPWANSGASVNAAIPAGGAGDAAQIERQKQMAELKAMQMAMMKSMRETNRVDPKQVDAMLVKIKEVTGSSTFNGIDLDALRANLAKAEKVQRIAEEMQREAAKPGGADPKKIQAYAEQLNKLQMQTFMAPQNQLNSTAPK